MSGLRKPSDRCRISPCSVPRSDGPHRLERFAMESSQYERSTGPSPDATYSVGEAAAATNIPRSTLLYYESHGIVAPEKNAENGYRSYNNQDLFRLANTTMLKNIGIPPKAIGTYLQYNPFTPERLDEYIALLEHREEYLAAERDCLKLAKRVQLNMGTIETTYIEPYYICFGPAETLNLLGMHAPICSAGAIFDGDFFDINVRPYRCKTVPVRHAHLIPGFDTSGLTVVGGCECLVAYKFEHDVHIPRAEQGSIIDCVCCFLNEHGLETCAPAFVPFSLSSAKGTSVPVCLPIRHSNSD